MDLANFENDYWLKNKQNIVHRHKAALELIDGGSVLDIGCGDGLFLDLLKQKGIRGEGLDISQTAVQKCSERGIKARQYDFSNTRLPYGDKSFDYVVMLDLLEHLYDPFKLLMEAKRVARRSIILSTPNFNSLPARLQMLRGGIPENNKHRQGHVYWFNYQILKEMLKETGLEICEMRINTFWENKKIAGVFTRRLSSLIPNLFGLSYVVKAK